MKRAILAITIAAIVGAGTYGLAASLGVSSDTLGAGSATVAACQPTASGNINVSYVAGYSATAPVGYQATTVKLNNVDESTGNCDSKKYRVTLTGAGNAPLGEQTGTTGATGANSTESMTFSGVSAVSVTGVQVVITG